MLEAKCDGCGTLAPEPDSGGAQAWSLALWGGDDGPSGIGFLICPECPGELDRLLERELQRDRDNERAGVLLDRGVDASELLGDSRSMVLRQAQEAANRYWYAVREDDDGLLAKVNRRFLRKLAEDHTKALADLTGGGEAA